MQPGKWQSRALFTPVGPRTPCAPPGPGTRLFFPMAKPELGLKRVCVSCGTKFYDLTRAPAICPKCGTEQPAEQPRLKRAAPPPDERVKKRAAVAEVDAEEGVEVDADADDETIEDAEELEDADEELGDDLVVESDREEES
jgi:uncharacterized protein (TIGR02300 family)